MYVPLTEFENMKAAGQEAGEEGLQPREGVRRGLPGGRGHGVSELLEPSSPVQRKEKNVRHHFYIRAVMIDVNFKPKVS